MEDSSKSDDNSSSLGEEEVMSTSGGGEENDEKELELPPPEEGEEKKSEDGLSEETDEDEVGVNVEEDGSSPLDDDEEESEDQMDEIDQLLDEALASKKPAKKRAKGEGEENNEEEGKKADKEYHEKEIIVLDDVANNSLEVLPGSWIEVKHSSGLPLYLHRPSRVCTLSKPYYLGPASARRHSIPLSGIPCLAYRRQREQQPQIQLFNGIEKCPMASQNKNGNEVELKRRLEDEDEPDSAIGKIDNMHKRTKLATDDSSNVVASGDGEANLGELIQSPGRHSLSVAQEEATSSAKAAEMVTVGTTALTALNESSASATLQALPVATVSTAQENRSMHSISPEDLRNYCKQLFKFRTIKCKRFKTWGARRRHTKEQKRLQLERPTMPDGLKLIVFPTTDDGGKTQKRYALNPHGKSPVCILHEYVQHSMHHQPSYDFSELQNSATPYAATVTINKIQYGTGVGQSKKLAKSDAAKSAIEILLPKLKDELNAPKSYGNSDFDILPFFEQYGLSDAGIAKVCKNFSEPPPYALLLTCLQRNYGQDGSNNVKFEMIASGPQSNRFKMEAGGHMVEVQAPNKREGKQLASQQLLAKLHPHFTNFGSFVKLYGNNSVKSVKEKKQEEQQITTLQSKASANSPNWAILSKLKMEMKKLTEQLAKIDTEKDNGIKLECND